MTRYKVSIPFNVEDKLSDIFAYIELDNPERAESFISGMILFMHERLETMPFSGKEVKNGIRMIHFGRYNIFYTVNKSEKTVFVTDIFSGNQDWEFYI